VNRFIVIEGLDATGKSTLVEYITSRISATKLSCPPEIQIPSIQDGNVRSHFDSQDSNQRRAYYRFTNLVASELVGKWIDNNNVIMDRYWTSTAAFAAMDDDLDLGIPLGEYPPEIRIPDVLILLTVDEDNRLKRMQGRGEAETLEEVELASNEEKRQKVLNVYKVFNPIIVDTSNKTQAEVGAEVMKIIMEEV